MGTVVLDAGVLIGHLEATDTHHAASRAALERHGADNLVLPASAYAEALVGPIRRGQGARARAEIANLELAIGELDRAGAEAAAAIRARHPVLRLPDALVLGHAEAIDADVVLTTDARWAQVSDRVRVVG